MTRTQTVKTVNYTKTGKVAKDVSSHVNMNAVLAIGLFGAAMWLRVAYLIIVGM